MSSRSHPIAARDRALAGAAVVCWTFALVAVVDGRVVTTAVFVVLGLGFVASLRSGGGR